MAATASCPWTAAHRCGQGWALGYLRGHDMFTDTARDDADIIHRTVCQDRDRTIAERIVPDAVFTDPKIAAVG